MIERGFVVIDISEAFSSIISGFEGPHFIARGLRNLIPFNGKGKGDKSYSDRV